MYKLIRGGNCFLIKYIYIYIYSVKNIGRPDDIGPLKRKSI